MPKEITSTPLTASQVLQEARTQAFRGGIAGLSAQVINVLSFMWLRTTMNYQYRYGGTLPQVLNLLWKDGGITRFYRGLTPALIQSPLSRFGDTAANAGVLALLNSNPTTASLPVGAKTALCSAGAAGFRLLLMPIDAWKTCKQVEGRHGMQHLVLKVRTHGVSKLFHGSAAAMGATWVGHYPWFFTFNYLDKTLPAYHIPLGESVRNASIGFTASVVSDTCSNSIRVIKTAKQTHHVPVTYQQVVKMIVQTDGLRGLFGRGLPTRILTNGIQVR